MEDLIKDKYELTEAIYKRLLNNETANTFGDFKKETINAFINHTKAFSEMIIYKIPEYEKEGQESMRKLIKANDLSILQAKEIFKNRN